MKPFKVIRNIIKKFLRNNILFLTIAEKFFSLQNSSFLPLRVTFMILSFPLYLMLQDDYYKLLMIIQKLKFIKKNKKNNHIKRLFSYCSPKNFFIKIINGDKSISVDDYLNILNKSSLKPEMQFIWAQRFMELGRLDLARIGFLELISRLASQCSDELRLQIFRYIGVTCFLTGKNDEANHFWKLAGYLRRTMFTLSTPRKYKILGLGWCGAIGHIAMLDYYLKYIKLFFGKDEIRIVAAWEPGQIPAKELIKKFVQLGITIIHPKDLEKDYNAWAIDQDCPTWNQLSPSEKAAMVDDFWEYDFPDGEILGFAHAIARIQSAWEQAQKPSLFTLSQNEKEMIADYLDIFGIPRNAWYVCLHVRESGFHKEWNFKYPSMRDADIKNYYLAIEKIVQAGGWIIRMGDPSMKPLPTLPNVVDYAHSPYKTPTADILLAAGARFILGTNSGYANLCSMYNVPCALTNWVPIGWPLWLSQDLMIPKLFRKKGKDEYLTLKEIFEKGLAFLQNWSDIPSDIEIIENTSEEIEEITVEMLNRFNNQNPSLSNPTSSTSLQDYYKKVAAHYSAFTGSQLANSFLKKHSIIFSSAEPIESL